LTKWRKEGRVGSDILGFGGDEPGELLDEPKPGGIYTMIEELLNVKLSP
jgi:hypothetical protein